MDSCRSVTARKVYMDNAATTPLRHGVLDAMMPFLKEKYGNPSSIHSWGLEAREAVETARAAIATAIGARDPGEVVFTSGGTESDNMAITGLLEARKEPGGHVIASSIEHHAVLDTCKRLQKRGVDVTFLPVDSTGLVDPGEVRKALRKDTALITVMSANNEVGTLQPVAEIGRIAREAGVPFVSDAVQTIGHLPFDVAQAGVHMASVSAHKFGGPKGIGALYVRKGTRLAKLTYGGGQEKGRRAGTENVPGIVGMGEALKMATAGLPGSAVRLAALRDRLVGLVMDRIGNVRLNGHPTLRLPGNVSFCFEFIEGESILLELDARGVAASTGSACTSGQLEPSHVLLAMGVPDSVAQGSLRLTLGDEATEEDVDYVVACLVAAVQRLRAMSPTVPGSGPRG